MNAYDQIVAKLNSRQNVLSYSFRPDGAPMDDRPSMIVYWLKSDSATADGTAYPTSDSKLSYVRFTSTGRIRKADGRSLGFMDSRDPDKLNRVINDINRLATAAEVDLRAAAERAEAERVAAKLDEQNALLTEQLHRRGVQDPIVQLVRPMTSYSPAELAELRTIADGDTNTPARRIARLRLERLAREHGQDVTAESVYGPQANAAAEAYARATGSVAATHTVQQRAADGSLRTLAVGRYDRQHLTARSTRLIRAHVRRGTLSADGTIKVGATGWPLWTRSIADGSLLTTRFTGWWATKEEVDPAAFEWFSRNR